MHKAVLFVPLQEEKADTPRLPRHGHAAAGRDFGTAEENHPPLLPRPGRGVRDARRPEHHRRRHPRHGILEGGRQRGRPAAEGEETVYREEQKNSIMKRKPEYVR